MTKKKNPPASHGHDHHEHHGHEPGHVCDAGCAHAPAQASGIYLVSPSSAVRDAAELELACQRLAAEGFQTKVDRAALAVHQRFAGTDKQRAAGLQRAIKQSIPS